MIALRLAPSAQFSVVPSQCLQLYAVCLLLWEKAKNTIISYAEEKYKSAMKKKPAAGCCYCRAARNHAQRKNI